MKQVTHKAIKAVLAVRMMPTLENREEIIAHIDGWGAERDLFYFQDGYNTAIREMREKMAEQGVTA